MTEYKDYGWQTATPSHTHAYLANVLLPMLPKDGSPILDIGCGNGSMAIFLLKQGYNIYGTDASEKGIQIARSTVSDRFFLQDLTKDSLPEQLREIPFRCIISTEVIEHLYNPRHYVSFCKQILQQSGGGDLILSTPYHGYIKNIVLSVTGAMDKHFTALWDGGHIKFWSKKSITVLLKEFDFEVIDFKGCGRLPYLWKSMMIHARVSVLK
ncbi:MAG: class I SAM-dependent methyltransferase [Bacteroidales bacterium]|nr:class I SAM-dependent methyltransferase [Bacteroidales bacterium]